MQDFYADLKNAIAEAKAENALLRAALYARERVSLDERLNAEQPKLTAAERQERHQMLERAIQRIEAEAKGQPVPSDEPAAKKDRPGLLKKRKDKETEASPAAEAPDDARAAVAPARRRHGRSAMLAAIVLLAAVIGGALVFWQWGDGGRRTSGLTGQNATASVTDAAEAERQEAATEEAARGAGSGPADRAYLLVEQDPPASEDKRIPGTARWSFDGSGADSTLTVAADFPELSAEINLEMRPNSDSSFPASHTIEVVYRGPDNPDGNIADIAGFIPSSADGEAAAPLRGAGALVSPGRFLFGLSGEPTDREQNLSQLKARDWLLVLIQFESKRRGVIAIEKSGMGKEAMAKGFAAWEQLRAVRQDR